MSDKHQSYDSGADQEAAMLYRSAYPWAGVLHRMCGTKRSCGPTAAHIGTPTVTYAHDYSLDSEQYCVYHHVDDIQYW